MMVFQWRYKGASVQVQLGQAAHLQPQVVQGSFKLSKISNTENLIEIQQPKVEHGSYETSS